MRKKLRKLIFLKYFSGKTKLILALFFLLLFSWLLTRNYLKPVQADIVSYTEDFTTDTYKDSANTTGNWDLTANEAKLLGQGWVNTAETSAGYDNVSQTAGISLFYLILYERHSEDIQVDASGNPYVVWRDMTDGNWEIYFSKWTPGTGWTKMDGTLGHDNVSNTLGFSYRQVIQLDSSGNPYIIWSDDDTGNYEIYFTKWTPGIGWTQMNGSTLGYEIISNNAGTSSLPLIRIDSSDNPYVVWTDDTSGNNEIYFSKWTPGTGWTQMDGSTLGYDNLSNDSGISAIAQIQIDSADNPYVVWEDYTFGNSEIYFSKWTPGTGWTQMDGVTPGYENLSNNAGNSQKGKIMLNSADVPYILWQDDTLGNDEIYFSKWTAGTGWTQMDGVTLGSENLSNDAGNSKLPQLQIDSANNPFAVWSDDTVGNSEIYFSKWTPGTGWTQMDGATLGADNLSNDAGTSESPILQIDSSNNAYVTWFDNTPGNGEIYFSKWNGSTWTGANGVDQDSNPATYEFDNLSNDSGESRTPIMVIDTATNNIFVVWQDDTSGNNEIYASKWLINYASSSVIQSLNVNNIIGDYVTSATLTANETLNPNPPDNHTITYYLSNDSGLTWNQVTSGSLYTFSNLGADLRWKAVLSTNNSSTTPVINDLSIKYYTKGITCSLNPINLKVGNSVNINASLNFVPTSVWATIENNGNLINTVILNDQGGGSYANSVTTASNYLGQDDVAVFAIDSGTGETLTCNPSNGASWIKKSVNDIPWDGRFKHNMVSFKNKLWVIGGFTNDYQSDVWSSSDGENWQQVVTNAPWGERRGEQKVIVFNNKMWLLGGFNLSSNWTTLDFYNDVWSSVDGINWVQETSNGGWTPRSSFGLAVYQNKLWISGGCSHVDAGLVCDDTLNDVWSSSDGITWNQETAGAPWTKRTGFKMLNYDDGSGEQLWIFGGLTLPSGSRLNDVWASTDGITWIQKTPAANWSTRSIYNVLVYDNGGGSKLWLFGGNGGVGNLHNDVWSSIDGITWTQEKADVAAPATGVQPSKWTHWSPRQAAQIAIFNNGTGDKLWLSGGYGLNTRNDVWYSTNAVDWTLVNQNYDTQYGILFNSQIMEYNNKMWLVGGFSKPSGLKNDVWSTTDGVNWTCEFGPYTLATDGIACNNPSPAFLARFSHRLLVYNNKLWLIGGCNDTSGGLASCPVAGRLRDVWSFDGATWTQVTPTAAWPGGYEQAASVFDNKMYYILGNAIWYSTDGATWTAAPSAPYINRIGHEALTYDNKLWVMGGYGSATRLNDVWYSSDPTTGVWNQATASAGWLGRYTFGLVNYDNKMWVFGGNRAGTTWADWLGSNEAWWSTDGIKWTQATDNTAWQGRDFFASTTFNNQIWLTGGDSNGGTRNDLWASAFNYLTFNVTSSSVPAGGGGSETAPNAPTNFSCSATSSDTVNWTFEDTATNETGFRLYGPSGLILSTEPSVITNIDNLAETNLKTNTLYANRYVKAFNSFGESTGSNTASCYTLANKPNPPEVHKVDETTITLDIEPNDGNPENTEYAIYETNSEQYVQADGSFGSEPVWQTREGWGGENGIEITGESLSGALDMNSQEINDNSDFTVSLVTGQEYSFVTKARNGDGIETEFSAVIAATPGQAAPTAPAIVATKGVGINLAKAQSSLSLSLIKSAQAQNGVVLPAEGESHWEVILRDLSLFLTIVLIILILLLFFGLQIATKRLAKNTKFLTKLKLAWHILSQEPARVFALNAEQAKNGTYQMAYSEHKDLHVFSQKNSKRLIGLVVIDLLLLTYVVIGLNHVSHAQSAPYDQDGQTVKVGDVLSYVIEVENQGDGEGLDINLADSLNSNLSYVVGSGKINLAGTETTAGINVNGNDLSFALHELEPNQISYVTFKAQVKVGSEDKNITNQASVSGSNFDTILSNITNNQVAAAVVVPPKPVCGNGTIEAGETCETDTDCAADQTCQGCQCRAVLPPVVPPPPVTAVCGNGTIETGETCETDADCLSDETCENCQCQTINIPQPPITPPGQPPVMPPTQPTPEGGTIIGYFSQLLSENETINFLRTEFFDNPQVEQASQNVVTPALITLALVNTLPTAIALSFNVLPYLYLVFSEPFLWFFRRKRKKWGIIYDSLTKVPVSLAVVRLYNKANNQLLQTKVTDKEGRYLMIVKEPGEYYITVTKPGYIYPTKYLSDAKEDTKYLDLYHGEAIKVTVKGAVLTTNIPLDPVDKKMVAEKNAVQNYIINNLRLMLAYLGLSLAVLVLIIYPTVITIASLILHIILFIIFRRLIVPPKPKSWGIVYDQKTKEPLTHAIVRIFDTKFNKLLETQVTDGKGRYAFLVGKNQYQLLTEKQGYQSKEIKPVDLIQKDKIVNLDVGLSRK